MHRAAPSETGTAVCDALFFRDDLQVGIPDRHDVLYPGKLILLNSRTIGFGVKPFEILGYVVGLLLLNGGHDYWIE